MKPVFRSAIVILFLVSICLLLPSCQTEKEPISDDSSLTSSAGEEPGASVARDPLEALFRCLALTEQVNSFSASTEGICETQVLFFNYRQDIRAERSKSGDEVFSQSVSTSSLVRVGVQHFFSGDTVLVREGTVHSVENVEWADQPVAVSQDKFHDAYGSVPRGFSNYILNSETVRSGYLLSETENTYTFVYTLDPNLSTIEYAKQVQTMGGLLAPPVFRSVELTVEMDKAFRPISVRYNETYDISIALLGNTTCKADYTETFSDWDAVDAVRERSYFLPFLQQQMQENYPDISSGYSLLYAILGDDASYNLTVHTAEQSIPLHLSFDPATGSIYVHGTDVDFLYAKDRYYFSVGETHISADAQAFNEQILPLTSLFSSVSARRSGNPLSDLLSGMQMENRDGKLFLHADADGNAFSAEIELKTMALLSAELSLDVSGAQFRAVLDRSPLKVTLPSTQGFTDITPSLSALSFIGELGSGKDLAYRLVYDGASSFSMALALSPGNRFRFSALSETESLPISVYGDRDSVSVVFSDLSVCGSYSELMDLLSVFRTSSVSRSARAFFFPQIRPEGKDLLITFSDATVLLAGDRLVYTSADGAVLKLILLGESKKPVAEAPITEQTLSLDSLTAFLSGSMYPAFLNAGTVWCDVELGTGSETYCFKTKLALSPKPAVSMTTVWNGMETGLLYSEQTVYLLTRAFNAFLDVDQLDKVTELFGSLGAAVPLARERSAFSVTCGADALTVFYDEIRVVLYKNAIWLSYGDIELAASGFAFHAEPTEFVLPDRADCIDLAALAETAVELREQSIFSFSGSYQDETLSAEISRLDFCNGQTVEEMRFAAELFLTGTGSAHRYQLIYDGESVYLDADGTKLFYLAPPLFALIEEFVPVSGRAGTDLSSLRSITFKDGILTIETDNALIRLLWEDDVLSRILYSSGEKKLSLRRSAYRPIIGPSMEGYTDITSIGDLIRAMRETYNSGSFSFSGSLGLRAFSVGLQDIRANGCISFDGGEPNGYLCLSVPYLKGLTSAGVPLKQGLSLLKSCSIQAEVFLTEGNLYIKRTVSAQYGMFQPKTVSTTEKRMVTWEEFLRSPQEALLFALNIETTQQNSLREGGETVDPAQKNILKRFVHDRDRYTLEFDPDALLPIAKQMVLTATVRERYLSSLGGTIALPILSLDGSVSLSDIGKADVMPYLQQDFSVYRSLYTMD